MNKLFRAFAAGAAIGAAVGAGEGIAVLSADPWWLLRAPLVPAAMLLYGAVGACVGFLAGLRESLSSKASVIVLAVLLYPLGCFYLLKPLLPHLLSAPALLRFAVWTVFWLFAGFIFLRRVESQGAWRFLWLVLVLLAALSLCGPRLWVLRQRAGQGAARAEAPNIVVVVMDTTRADHFSCYGYNRPTTPRVDKLAQEGVLFEQAVSAAPWTLPSHASLFTGLYTSQHGTDRATPRLNGSLATLAELLKAEGYQTAGFSNNPWVGQEFNFHQGFDLFEGMWDGSDPFHRLSFVWVWTRVQDRLGKKNPHRANASKTNRRVDWWLDKIRRDSSPFFLFLNYIDVHSPYKPREPFKSRFLQEESRREAAKKLDQARLQRTAPPVKLDPVTEGVLNDLYDAELSYLDDKVGELADLLNERGLLDKTVFVITSDHGENLGEHQQLGHRFCIYETLLRVPLIFRCPALFPGGVRVKEPVSLIDVLPTLMRLVRPQGGPLPPGLLGRELPLAGQAAPDGRFLISEYTAPPSWISKFRKENPELDESYFTRDLKSARRGNLKLIWGSDGFREMYDLAQDPKESVNLANQQPELAAALQQEALSFAATLKPAVPAAEATVMDENSRRELRALGYIQ